MPIEVEAFAPEEATKEATAVAIDPTQEITSPPEEAATEELVERPKAKARGRPRGSKNRPKAQAQSEEEEEVIVKRKPKKVVYISATEEEATPPPSPGTQRRNEWAAYRQKQVNAHQARSAHYTKALDKMLAF